MAVGLQRPGSLVECRGQLDERCLSRRRVHAARPAGPHRIAPPPQSCLTNRRIRDRTDGGVGGGSREASSYPIRLYWPKRTVGTRLVQRRIARAITARFVLHED